MLENAEKCTDHLVTSSPLPYRLDRETLPDSVRMIGGELISPRSTMILIYVPLRSSSVLFQFQKPGFEARESKASGSFVCSTELATAPAALDIASNLFNVSICLLF